MFVFLPQFQSLTNLPCGLESNNNNAAAGVSMDEEGASTDDDEHIRNDLADHRRRHRYRRDHSHDEPGTFSEKQPIAAANGFVNDQNSGGGNGGSGTGLEKFRIDYPKKYRTARSMSLSMERNAFCELCRVSRSSVSFDQCAGSGTEREDDKGVRRYFGFTIRQYMALGSLALVDFLGFCSMSVMAPTFPKEVRAYTNVG